MNIVKTSKMFLKRNGSTILTGVGSVGVIATAVMSAKATPKAIALLENAKQEKEELTTVDKIRIAGPAYIPAVITGAATIACIFGANALSKHQQAALMSAYALLDNSYKEYKAKVAELYGEEADANVREEIAKDHYKNTDISQEDEKQLFYDEYSARYFHSTIENVLQAEYKLNRMVAIDYCVYLNEFYDLLGIEGTDYGNYIGWSIYELNEMQWYSWIEFDHSKVIMDDGLECTIIRLRTDPSFDFENY